MRDLRRDDQTLNSKKTRRLSLSRGTVRNPHADELARVGGGVETAIPTIQSFPITLCTALHRTIFIAAALRKKAATAAAGGIYTGQPPLPDHCISPCTMETGGTMRATHTLSLLLFLALACNKGDVKQTPTEPLYKRLGEKNAIEAVVQRMLDNVKADSRINGKFANADLEGLKTKLVDQICQASGGPCQYTGKDMKTAHAGMGITEAEFGAMVEDLVKALDDLKVAEKEKTELLGILGPMKADIVEGGTAPVPTK